eukprot:Tamp_29122.p1 GENE.Tamp_29122~~Tamp_29122.p1  ORF type:complete len:226 (-),score=32.09 Tamp_29122:106-726(-)
MSNEGVAAVTGWFGNLANAVSNTVVQSLDSVSHVADGDQGAPAQSNSRNAPPPSKGARHRSELEQRAYELKVKAITNPALLQWILGRQYPVIGTDFYFMALRDEHKLRELLEHRKKVGLEDRVFFSIDEELLYFPFCADFGPLNIGCVSRFIKILNEKLAKYPKEGKSVVLVSTGSSKDTSSKDTSSKDTRTRNLLSTPRRAKVSF